MMYAERRATCETGIHRFTQDYAAKYPKAVKSLVTDVARLLTHFDFPAAHWKHLRSTNPIESTFATVKHRTRVTKGAGSRTAGLTMAFKLLETAQRTWPLRVNMSETFSCIEFTEQGEKGFSG